MSAFGKTLFGGSRFVRWTLTPFVLLFAVVMPLLVEKWTLKLAGIIAAMEFLCIALLAGFWLPARLGRWAFRSVAGAVFLAYAGYLIDQFFFSDTPFKLVGSRSQTSPLNALLGFVIVGLPCLWFALRGRFTLRDEPSPEQLAAERQAYEERILQPDWEFYERHLRRPAPAALRDLYANRALVTSGGLDCSKAGGISTFNPLDEDGLIDTADLLGFDVVPFATSDCGDAIFLRPGKDESDTVYIAYHDDPGKGLVVFADSVSAMLERLRKAINAT